MRPMPTMLLLLHSIDTEPNRNKKREQEKKNSINFLLLLLDSLAISLPRLSHYSMLGTVWIRRIRLRMRTDAGGAVATAAAAAADVATQTTQRYFPFLLNDVKFQSRTKKSCAQAH